MPTSMPEDPDVDEEVDEEECVGGEGGSSWGREQQLLRQRYRSLGGFVSGPNMIVTEEDVDELIYLRECSKINEIYKEYKKKRDAEDFTLDSLGGRGCFSSSKLADAIEHVRGLLVVGNVMSIRFIIIARDTPVKPYDRLLGEGAVVRRRKAKLRFVKNYVVITVPKLFRYLCGLPNFATYDEVVLSDRPTPLHFDVELKVGEGYDPESKAGEVSDVVYNSLVQIFPLDDIRRRVPLREGEEDGDYKRRVCAYCRIIENAEYEKCLWTEGQCQAGYASVRKAVEKIVFEILCGSGCEEGLAELVCSELRILSGCRRDKFSLHILLPQVLCDSNVITMPLVVFEVARRFAVENLMFAVAKMAETCGDDEDEFSTKWLDDDSLVFSARAVRPSAMLANKLLFDVDGVGLDGWVSDREMPQDGRSIPVYAGYNDTIFDEQIYSKNHLLRGPGACKAEGGVMLFPVDYAEHMMGSFETPFGLFRGGVQRSCVMSNFENPYGVDADDGIRLVEDISKAGERFIKDCFMGDPPEESPETRPGARCAEAVESTVKNPYANESRRMRIDRRESFFGEYLVMDPKTGPRVLLCDWKPSRAYVPKRRWYCSRETIGVELSDVYREDEDVTVVSGSGEYVFYDEKRLTTAVEFTEAQIRTIQLWARNDPWRNPMTNKFPVDPDEEFLSKSGLTKRFRYFRDGEWLHHVHNNEPERTPSAKVYGSADGVEGFNCFGCGLCYRVVTTNPLETPYYFQDDEIFESDDDNDYISSYLGRRGIVYPSPFTRMYKELTADHERVSRSQINWECATDRKFFVMDAPMGSGKTEEIGALVAYHTEIQDVLKSVVVITYRRALAKQLANRFNIRCYLDSQGGRPIDESKAFDAMLDMTICLNSIGRLPVFTRSNAYKIVVLDEIGLLRRHFVSNVTRHSLPVVWDKFVDIITSAENVIMAQEGITENDIAFVTNMCGVSSQDRTRVRALCFKKPLVLHPIKFTNDQNTALFHLVREFKKRICVDTPDPFVLYVSSVGVAEALTHYFRALCPEKADRIKGAWGAMKATDGWLNNFMSDPDKYAKDCNVLVTTSILGAGISITSHFGGFIALFHNRILTHGEEQQFSRRLRYHMKDLPDRITRNSIIFAQKGSGGPAEYTRIHQTGKLLRELIYNPHPQHNHSKNFIEQTTNPESALNTTASRVIVERHHSWAHHDTLWMEFGRSLDEGRFEQLEAVTGKEEEVRDIEWAMKESTNKRKRSLLHYWDKAFLGGDVLDDLTSVTEDISEIFQPSIT